MQSIKWNEIFNGCLGVVALILIGTSNHRKQFEQYGRASWQAVAAAVYKQIDSKHTQHIGGFGHAAAGLVQSSVRSTRSGC